MKMRILAKAEEEFEIMTADIKTRHTMLLAKWKELKFVEEVDRRDTTSTTANVRCTTEEIASHDVASTETVNARCTTEESDLADSISSHFHDSVVVCTPQEIADNDFEPKMINGKQTIKGPGPWGEWDYADDVFGFGVMPSIKPYMRRSKWENFYKLFNDRNLQNTLQRKSPEKFNFEEMLEFRKKWNAKLRSAKLAKDSSYVPKPRKKNG